LSRFNALVLPQGWKPLRNTFCFLEHPAELVQMPAELLSFNEHPAELMLEHILLLGAVIM